MRRQTHNASVFFRAPAWIIGEAERKAECEGMNLSELMRRALRRELGKEAA